MKTQRVRIEVRAPGMEIAASEAADLRVQLARSLRQFRPHLRSVAIWLADLNGPRGGDSDIECRIIVDGWFPTVIVAERAASAGAAVDVAAERVRDAVARAIGRGRTRERRQLRDPRARAKARH